MICTPETFQLPVTDNNGEVIGTKNALYRYCLSFTQEEKVEIRRILKKYDPAKVEHFISRLAGVCTDYLVFLLQRREPEIKEVINFHLPALEKALPALKAVATQKWPLVEQMKSVPGDTFTEEERRQHFPDPQLNKIAYADIPFLSKQALLYMNSLVKALEEIKPEPKRGRPSKDGKFSQAVADIFLDVFGTKPPPKSKSSFFVDILRLCLNGMGEHSEDPSRRLEGIS
jgi:hypothetical protein